MPEDATANAATGHAAAVNYAEAIPIAGIPNFDRRTANGPLAPSRETVNAALIGNPRGTYTEDCQPPQNPDFIALLETADVGPFRATGIRPALAALRTIFAEVRRDLPDLYGRLGSAGMLCCRLVRGSTTAVSNHAWGLAIDLTIDGRLDTQGDDRVQRGLLALWPYFNRHGFYWGIAFPTEDAMHFEAGEALVRKWAKDGAFGAQSGTTIARALTIGDRSPLVAALQAALNRELAPVRIAEDGIFGPQTRLAVIAVQRKFGLVPTGTAGAALLRRLGV